MAVLETTLVGGASALGGWLVLRRLHQWDPKGDRAGEVVARAGIGAADLVGEVVEGAAHIVAEAIRGSGQLTAKTAGVTVATAGAVAYKVVPGLGGSDTDDAEAEQSEVETAATKRAPAKKSTKKAGATRSRKTN
ncbi:MAG: hypothetical protein OEV40_17255 [Acidimicrobiia bacterium]|nr:hypothetical protein [Acidimicrobiia bacterium]